MNFPNCQMKNMYHYRTSIVYIVKTYCEKLKIGRKLKQNYGTETHLTIASIGGNMLRTTH